MKASLVSARFCQVLLAVLVFSGGALSQPGVDRGSAIMWERVNIASRDLYNGPGGLGMRPDLRRVQFIKRETGGNNLKYRIKDASGREWVAKIADESQPEVAANRLLWGIGYPTEIDYLVPAITIPGKGTFKNVRLEARPAHIERMGRWSWDENPFENSPEFRGLRIMMALVNNWDLKNTNNVIFRDRGRLKYAISDLGSSFGKLSGSSKFLLNRIGRSVNNPEHFSESRFIRGLEKGEIDFAYKGKRIGLFYGITPADGRWLVDLLLQLSDRQIRDAFRAASYSPAEVELLARAVARRINQLDRVSSMPIASS